MRVSVAATALVELEELTEILPRSLVISPYCFVFVVVSHSRTSLVFVAAESRDSKWPLHFLMMVIVSPLCPVPMAELAIEEGVMLWIALATSAVNKLSLLPVNALVSRSIARWRGPKYPVQLFHVCSEEGLL